MLTPAFLGAEFEASLEYEAYVATGTPAQIENWRAFDRRVVLTDAQRALIGGFTRTMPVLVTSGTWCGDCVAQCPMLAAIGRVNPEVVRVRFVDRDEHRELAERIQICGGRRVPTVIFMNELFDFVALMGDRTLQRYRAMAAKNLGGACPLPGAPIPADEVAATLQDWVDEFERVQLLLRLSPKMRELHGD